RLQAKHSGHGPVLQRARVPAGLVVRLSRPRSVRALVAGGCGGRARAAVRVTAARREGEGVPEAAVGDGGGPRPGLWVRTGLLVDLARLGRVVVGSSGVPGVSACGRRRAVDVEGDPRRPRDALRLADLLDGQV